ncbi:hypothetical protein DSL72_004013 [Monilinia vaccinii-corymbosi]|uniref:Uncharacterized protein n=1 Tax=Monilinia vaccinii-corymbosi TaxID=61207 RepID=A0A8A3P8F5_9HELO|nr:hypothetical protein DSL72_004013 [Monilinia vaccinii-corymbosi]
MVQVDTAPGLQDRRLSKFFHFCGRDALQSKAKVGNFCVALVVSQMFHCILVIQQATASKLRVRQTVARSCFL